MSKIKFTDEEKEIGQAILKMLKDEEYPIYQKCPKDYLTKVRTTWLLKHPITRSREICEFCREFMDITTKICPCNYYGNGVIEKMAYKILKEKGAIS